MFVVSSPKLTPSHSCSVNRSPDPFSQLLFASISTALPRSPGLCSLPPLASPRCCCRSCSPKTSPGPFIQSQTTCVLYLHSSSLAWSSSQWLAKPYYHYFLSSCFSSFSMSTPFPQVSPDLAYYFTLLSFMTLLGCRPTFYSVNEWSRSQFETSTHLPQVSAPKTAHIQPSGVSVSTLQDLDWSPGLSYIKPTNTLSESEVAATHTHWISLWSLWSD